MKGKLVLIPFLGLRKRPGSRPTRSGYCKLEISECGNRHMTNRHSEVTEFRQDPRLGFKHHVVTNDYQCEVFLLVFFFRKTT